MKQPFENYLHGKSLYGDDFEPDEILRWFEDEREAYANLGAAERSTYAYGYHELNNYHGFRKLPCKQFNHAVGMGSAYGLEFEPIADRIKKITIIEPSSALNPEPIGKTPIAKIDASPSGEISIESGEVDLMLCFGVLHHIPNISHVLGEIYRCLTPGGFALIREPIISMGDWRRPRAGLTKHERGIPYHLLRGMVLSKGFHIVARSFCMFPTTPRLGNLIGNRPYNNSFSTKLDAMLSQCFSWNRIYHRTTFLSKLGPTCVFLVLEKS